MPFSDSTLFELMAVLPDLHPSHLISSNITTVKVLRLVSKEMGNLAAAAITSCDVVIGDTQSSNAERIATLVAGAKLRELRVVVCVTSGERNLETCPCRTSPALCHIQHAKVDISSVVLNGFSTRSASGPAQNIEVFYFVLFGAVKNISQQQTAVNLDVTRKSLFRDLMCVVM